MKFEELKRQLPGKQRSIADLARYVQTRTDDNSNYNLLLGAGCSINSGIRSAAELVKLWRTEIISGLPGSSVVLASSVEDQKEFLKQHYSDWYEPNREYSALFERRYDLQRQRRMFVESEVAKAFPSIGYAYLTSLVGRGFFRTLFTTNFDDLLNEAFYSFSSERPIVCAHDSSIGSITVTSKRPKIIKIHGDYLFDDLKATVRETESLETNMKAKFAEFAKEAGFIVVGYSGADRSVMDIFGALLKNDDFLKGGVYWCLRSDSEVPEELRRIFWRDRAYFVEIDGFDELFAELFNTFNPEEVLPSSLTATSRPSGVTERLLSQASAFPETSDVLKRARLKLSSLTKRSAIAGLIVQSNDEERPAIRGQKNDLTDDELLVLTEASNLISDGRYQASLDKLNEALHGDCRPMYKRRLLKEQIQAFRMKGNDIAALAVVDQLVAMNPAMGSNYLLKARIESNESKRLAAIESAVDAEPYMSLAVLEKAKWHDRASTELIGEARATGLQLVHDLLNNCLQLNPSISNPAWSILFDVIGRMDRFNKVRKQARQKDLLDQMAKQNPESFAVLSKRLALAEDSKDSASISSVLECLAMVERRFGLESVPWVAGLQLDAYVHLRDVNAIEKAIQRFLTVELLHRETDLAFKAACAIRKIVGDESRSEKILLEGLRRWDFDFDVFEELFQQYLDLRRIVDAEKLLADWGHQIVEGVRLRLLTELYEAKGDYAKACSTVRERSEKSGLSLDFDEVFLQLCAGNSHVAEGIARARLARFNFSPEAAADIVNYELARKMQGKKPDATRLEAVLKFSDNDETSAAIYCLLGKKMEMVKAIKESFERDRRFKYTFMRWPVFAEARKEADIAAIFCI